MWENNFIFNHRNKGFENFEVFPAVELRKVQIQTSMCLFVEFTENTDFFFFPNVLLGKGFMDMSTS